MNITVFTGNQPRHIAFVNKISNLFDRTYCIQECTTAFPGMVADFYNKSPVMQTYFSQVVAAEKKIFPSSHFLNSGVNVMPIKLGDINFISQDALGNALKADCFIVFGASYIKGWLGQFLQGKKAINIHMGLSPYYRGAACNFWALFDGRPEYVGGTIHYLSEGLDDGEILFHALPTPLAGENPFEFTMRSVDVAQTALLDKLVTNSLGQGGATQQNANLLLRYSKNKDFTDAVAQEFLDRTTDLKGSYSLYPDLLAPVFGY